MHTSLDEPTLKAMHLFTIRSNQDMFLAQKIEMIQNYFYNYKDFSCYLNDKIVLRYNSLENELSIENSSYCNGSMIKAVALYNDYKDWKNFKIKLINNSIFNIELEILDILDVCQKFNDMTVLL